MGNLLKVAKLAIALFWLALFFYQTSFILEQWAAKETAMSTQYIHNKRLQLPLISLCPRDPFKCVMKNITEEEYLNCTYGFDELFTDKTRNADWNLTEFRSVVHGRCFTFQHSENVKAIHTRLSIGLPKGMDLNAYGM